MTSEEYFNLKMIDGMPVLSNSLIKLAMPVNAGSPARIKAGWDQLYEKEETPAMKLGSLVHAYFEDKDRFAIKPEIELSDNVRIIVDKLYEVAKETSDQIGDIIDYAIVVHDICSEVNWGMKWKPQTRIDKLQEQAGEYWQWLKENSTKTIIPGATAMLINNIIESVKDSGFETPVLLDYPIGDSYREQGIVADMDGLKFKVLPDYMNVNHDKKEIVIIDFKTTSYPVEKFISYYDYLPDPTSGIPQIISKQGDYLKYKYYMQEYLYKRVVAGWSKEKFNSLYKVKFYFIVMETGEPFAVELISTRNKWEVIAKGEFIQAMKNIREWIKQEKFNEF